MMLGCRANAPTFLPKVPDEIGTMSKFMPEFEGVYMCMQCNVAGTMYLGSKVHPAYTHTLYLEKCVYAGQTYNLRIWYLQF